ncbi:Uu.00g047250.m01.CDS01 [Anthostomella pinea]|uniref:Uu.00g047250.m01.CDS01 n=1 Tax=Anthostomella pinea TaxID=933095 RepID=A0AAI8YEK9_9PEZI|nr:Uu.00g047250.m01.CDS01 [Anthostomella pinea]
MEKQVSAIRDRAIATTDIGERAATIEAVILKNNQAFQTNVLNPSATPFNPAPQEYHAPDTISRNHQALDAAAAPPAQERYVVPHRRFEERFNPNYRGNPGDPLNQSVGIPLHMSTSLWVTGLPGDCTVHELLEPIRNIGKVYFVHINRPLATIPTSAAKIVMWTVEGKTDSSTSPPEAPFRSEIIN